MGSEAQMKIHLAEIRRMGKEGCWGRELGRSQLILLLPPTFGGFFPGSDSEHTEGSLAGSRGSSSASLACWYHGVTGLTLSISQPTKIISLERASYGRGGPVHLQILQAFCLYRSGSLCHLFRHPHSEYLHSQ